MFQLTDKLNQNSFQLAIDIQPNRRPRMFFTMHFVKAQVRLLECPDPNYDYETYKILPRTPLDDLIQDNHFLINQKSLVIHGGIMTKWSQIDDALGNFIAVKKNSYSNHIEENDDVTNETLIVYTFDLGTVEDLFNALIQGYESDIYNPILFKQLFGTFVNALKAF
jgi:hypothetical protein